MEFFWPFVKANHDIQLLKRLRQDIARVALKVDCDSNHDSVAVGKASLVCWEYAGGAKTHRDSIAFDAIARCPRAYALPLLIMDARCSGCKTKLTIVGRHRGLLFLIIAIVGANAPEFHGSIYQADKEACV